MKTPVTTTVKTYNSNADIFFSVNGESIGSTSVHYSSDDIDIYASLEYNMRQIIEQVLNEFNKIKEEHHALDLDVFDFEMNKIAIKISPRVK